MYLNPCEFQCGVGFAYFSFSVLLRMHFVPCKICKVKTGVVGVPCGIEGSMVNEFVEALDS